MLNCLLNVRTDIRRFISYIIFHTLPVRIVGFAHKMVSNPFTLIDLFPRGRIISVHFDLNHGTQSGQSAQCK